MVLTTTQDHNKTNLRMQYYDTIKFSKISSSNNIHYDHTQAESKAVWCTRRIHVKI